VSNSSLHEPSPQLRYDLRRWLEATNELVGALVAEPGLMVNAADDPLPEIAARSSILARCGISLGHVAIIYSALFMSQDVVQVDAQLSRIRTND
jgi:hypothetical protein